MACNSCMTAVKNEFEKKALVYTLFKMGEAGLINECDHVNPYDKCLALNI